MGHAQSECVRRRRRNKQEKLISTRVEEMMGRKKISPRLKTEFTEREERKEFSVQKHDVEDKDKATSAHDE